MLDVHHPHYAELEPLFVYVRAEERREIEAGRIERVVPRIVSRVRRTILANLLGAGAMGTLAFLEAGPPSWAAEEPDATQVVLGAVMILVALAALVYAVRWLGRILHALTRLRELASGRVAS